MRLSAGNTGYYRGILKVTGPGGWILTSPWLLDSPGGSSTNKGGQWNLIGVERSGATFELYMNGQ